MPYPKAYADYLQTLPFLGRVESSHHTVIAGSY
jgi:hypothetical protein